MMIDIEQLFSLLLACAVTASAENVTEICTTPEMTKVPYEPMEVDEQLPKFEEGHWYMFEFPDSKQARLEVLIKDGKVLQAGVEIVYLESAYDVATGHFQTVARLANRQYGAGTPIDMGGVENLNYGDTKSVFYVINAIVSNQPFLVFRAGNREFWP